MQHDKHTTRNPANGQTVSAEELSRWLPWKFYPLGLRALTDQSTSVSKEDKLKPSKWLVAAGRKGLHGHILLLLPSPEWRAFLEWKMAHAVDTKWLFAPPAKLNTFPSPSFSLFSRSRGYCTRNTRSLCRHTDTEAEWPFFVLRCRTIVPARMGSAPFFCAPLPTNGAAMKDFAFSINAKWKWE